LKSNVERTGDGVTKCRLPYPRDSFDQQMSAGEDGHQGHAHDLIFSANDGAESTFKLRGPA
jgi:hypothetical protein